MQLLTNIGITVLIGALSAFGVFKYVPLSWYDDARATFGSTITTIQGTDSLSSSRSVINTNFSNLNTDKLQSGSYGSTLNIGTLSAGVFSATTTSTSTFAGGVAFTGALDVNSSSATSTFANGLRLEGGCLEIGSTCISSSIVSSITNSDSTLTISPTTGNAIASLNLGNTNIWTVHQIFSSLFGTNASTTNATTTGQLSVPSGRTSFNGIYYSWPSVQGASSTIPATNGSGSLSWNTLGNLGGAYSAGATTTNTTITDDTAEVTYANASGSTLATLPAGVMGTNGGISARLYLSAYTDSGANSSATIRFKLGGTTVCTISLPTAASGGGAGWIDVYVRNLTASSQICLNSYTITNASGLAQTAVSEGSSSVDTSAALAVTFSMQYADNPGDTETMTGSAAQVTFLGKN